MADELFKNAKVTHRVLSWDLDDDRVTNRRASVCMCLKCIEVDADFHAEVAALVRDLSVTECERAIKIVCADRKHPMNSRG